jgi:RND family efflux transporter MFP subunit
VQVKVSVDEIANAKAELEQAKADLGVLMTRKSDLIVRAPLDGVVVQRQVNVGEFMQPSQPLMTLVALDQLYFEAQVPELEISLVKQGMTANVSVDSIPGKQFKGVVREIIPVADATSRMFRVRIGILGARGQLPPNAYARAKVHVGSRPQAVVVDKNTIQTESGDKYVWLIAEKEGKLSAVRQIVKTGLVDEKHAEILDGLKPGDRVVGAGSPAIIEGTALVLQGANAGSAPKH